MNPFIIDKVKGGREVKCSMADSALRESLKMVKLETGKVKVISLVRIMAANSAIKTEAILGRVPL